jgi:lipoic acid synthetase
MPDNPQLGSYDRRAYTSTLDLLKRHGVNTVCMEANCPNRYECFAERTATFMVLGDTCTRQCGYCGVKKGIPDGIDIEEPMRIADAVKELGLSYAVLTSVTRDDLRDHGARVIANTVREIRSVNPGCKVEVLIPDLNASWSSLQEILAANPDVINHNIEVIAELFAFLRPLGNYRKSLHLLTKAKQLSPGTLTKSGFMVGFGETGQQIRETMQDIRDSRVDILTIGQYLRPGRQQVEVRKFYSDEEFDEFRRIGMEMGFRHVESGPLVRSSYRADKYVEID